jgi:hypothetical protein
MNIVAEKPSSVNKKLRFGKIIRSPIVAWAFNAAAADISPIPVAYGGYALFLKNRFNTTWQFVPAAPGSYEVSYLVDPEYRKGFGEEHDMQRLAGAMYLGAEVAGDTEESNDWVAQALDYENECGPESEG